MAGQIKLNYNEVYEKTAILDAQIDATLKQMNAEYSQLEPLLNEADGSSNAALKETIDANKKKAYTAANTLTKLLSSITSSAKSAEEMDLAIERVFQSSSPRNTGRW